MRNIAMFFCLLCLSCLTACGSESGTTVVGNGTYTISGTVVSDNEPLSGVTVTLTGGSTGSATTETAGQFSFSGTHSGNYTLTPSLTGYTFNPVSITVTVTDSDVANQNLGATASPAPTYAISGTVTTAGNNPMEGVKVTLIGPASGAVFSNTSGNYRFNGLMNGNYTLTPDQADYSLTPDSLSVTVSGADVTGNDFTNATLLAPRTCSGTMNGTRWCDQENGTVMDMTTGKVWLKNANCAGGSQNWFDSTSWAASLASGTCGLADGSLAGAWRLPTWVEMWALASNSEPVTLQTPRAFTNFQAEYWSSDDTGSNMKRGFDFYAIWEILTYEYDDFHCYGWAVRK